MHVVELFVPLVKSRTVTSVSIVSPATVQIELITLYNTLLLFWQTYLFLRVMKNKTSSPKKLGVSWSK